MTSSVSLPGGLELLPGSYRSPRGWKDNLRSISLSAWELPWTNLLDLPEPSSEDSESERLLSPEQVSKAKSSPLNCGVVCSRGWYEPARHLQLLNDYLMLVEAGEIKRLMVFMPPQHGKSETVSHFFPAWYIGRHPEQRLALVSYNQTWAEHWGREVRDTLREYGPSVWGIDVRRDTSSVSDWRLQGHRGGMVARGIGAGLTGRPVDGGIIFDDVVKDAEEAYSQTIQQRNWDWYQSVAKTRLSADAWQIVMMTRWHEADLAWKILEAEAHGWTVLVLPALAEPGDPMERREGEALWPESGKDADWLAEVRYGAVNPATGKREGGISEYWFSALYQQRPSPESGLMFQRAWWQYYETVPAGQHPGGIFVDVAITQETYSDYSVLAPVVRVIRDLYWLDLRRGRWTAPQLLQQCIDAQDEFRLPLIVEETTISKQFIQMLRSRGLTVIGMPVTNASKRTRAEVAAPYAEAGHFFLPHQGWTKAFIEEHAQFPSGSHDDMVDTTSAAATRLLVQGGAPHRSTVLNWEVR